MAVNERVQRNINDLPADQLSPAGLARTEYYPGKASSKLSDLLPTEFRIPVGVRHLEEAGPLEVERVRIEKLGRSSVSDQTIAAPVVTGSTTTVIDDNTVWGTGPDPEHTLTETETQDVDGEQERTAGYDWAKGLE